MSDATQLPPRAQDSLRAPSLPKRGRLPTVAWTIVAYTLFVVLFGAVVRVTGSGAGCGQHWPTCHGEIAHLPKRIETVIEITHRLTSGLSLVFVIGLVLATRRALAPGHLGRRMAVWSLAFLVVEALLGAGLVLFELVADNASPARAAAMTAHLVNTSMLMLCLTVTAWACSRAVSRVAWRSGAVPLILLGLAALLVVSGTGALTALGDTLYPVAEASALSDRVAEAKGAGTFLEQLRSLHPIVALLAAAMLYLLAGKLGQASDDAGRLGAAVKLALLTQLGLGVTNIWLSAPGWMQVTHLAVANVVWVLWVLLAAELLVQRDPVAG
jgi:heme A synthase